MKITQLRRDDLWMPVLRVLSKLGGSGLNEEINSGVIEAVGLTDDDLTVRYQNSGSLMAPHKIAFARTDLRGAGIIKSEGRGLWVITESGRELFQQGEAEVCKAVRDAQREYSKNYNAQKTGKKADKFASIEAGENLSEDAWSDALLAKVQTIDPAAFERLCQLLLRKNGFTQVEVTGKSGDGGIDGKGVVRVNLVSFHVLFQCKRYQGSVGSSTVRDFRGAMQGRADKGLIITTGTFTADARRESTRDGAPAIDLIDGTSLCELLKEHRLGVAVEMVECVTVTPAFFDDL